MASAIPSVALAPYPRYTEEEMRSRAKALHQALNSRRTVRDFSDTPVPREVVEACIATAGTAPSGANQQP
ncbi:MAG: nitroreductase family protein, partial [Proteobacteria bacterium]|nr:nitroreductase family protein [Pseudomonadota bacterium]